MKSDKKKYTGYRSLTQLPRRLLRVATQGPLDLPSGGHRAQPGRAGPAVGRGLSAALPAGEEVQPQGHGEDVEGLHRMAQEKQRRPAPRTAPPTQHYYFPELLQLRKVYPHGYHKHDKKVPPAPCSTGPSTLNGWDSPTPKRSGSSPPPTGYWTTTACYIRRCWTASSRPARSRRSGRRATGAE